MCPNFFLEVYSVQNPWKTAFLCLDNWPCIKFLLIELLLFFAILAVFYRKIGGGHFVGCWNRLSLGERRDVITWGAVYFLFCLAGLCPNGPLQALHMLSEAAEGFLIVEPLLVGVMLLLVVGSHWIRGSQLEYLNTLNAIVRILTVVSVVSMLLVRQIFPLWWCNILWILVVGILLFLLKILSLERLPEAETSGGLFEPVGTYNALFPLRRIQADELCRIIGSETSGGISVCVTGPWGSGKTSLVRGACYKLRQDKNYEFIFLHALELDSLSSLFHYLFARIQEILKDRGAYVGPGSEYRRLIASAGGLITSTQLSSVLERKLFRAEEDYRSQRQRLEGLMEKVLQDDKLVIVVDDIERCEPGKAREFLYFVKEIATMKCCVSVFITDDSSLPLPEHIKNKNFFDKFFNYRIVLCQLQILDMMKHYEHEMDLTFRLSEFHLDLPSTVYPQLKEQLREGAKSVQPAIAFLRTIGRNQSECENEAKNRQAYLYACLDRLGEPLSYPRTILKFYKVYQGICERLGECYQSQSPGQVKEYFESLKLPALLFLLAYVEVCFPIEWEEIQRSGFRNYLNQIQEDPGEPKRFLLEFMQNTLFRDEPHPFANAYQKNKQIRFLDTLLNSPEELPNIANGFTTQEQEWFDAIQKGNKHAIEANWYDMLRIVVEQYSKLDNGRVYLERLIQFAKEQVTLGHWKVDMLLQIFRQDNLNQLDSLNNKDCIVPLVSLFDQAISQEPVLAEVSEKVERELHAIVPFYLYDYVRPICCALQYAVFQERDIILNAWKSILTDRQDQITGFLTSVQQCKIWKKRLPDNLKGLDGLETLLKDAKEILMENRRWSYPDAQETFKMASDSMLELRALSHLQAQIHLMRTRGSISRLSIAFQNDNLPEAIFCIKRSLKQPESYPSKQMQREFYELFEYIKGYKPGEIPRQELQELHDLITQYYELQPIGYRSSAISFREILMGLEEESQDSPTLV